MCATDVSLCGSCGRYMDFPQRKRSSTWILSYAIVRRSKGRELYDHTYNFLCKVSVLRYGYSCAHTSYLTKKIAVHTYNVPKIFLPHLAFARFFYRNFFFYRMSNLFTGHQIFLPDLKFQKNFGEALKNSQYIVYRAPTEFIGMSNLFTGC